MQAETQIDQPKNQSSGNLRTRLITAVVLIPISLLGMYVGGALWLVMMTAIAIIGILEFFTLERGSEIQGSTIIGLPSLLLVLMGFYTQSNTLIFSAILLCVVATFILETARHPQKIRQSLMQVGSTLLGICYLGFPLGFLIAISHWESRFVWLVVIFSLTWGCDTFAYFGGRLWGKRKLAPKLSPKKTVEGAIVGSIGGFIPALLFLTLGGEFSWSAMLMLAIAPIMAILGDLFESGMKRAFNVKDSHIAGLNVIPGHGGVLDRIDSLLAVALFCYLWIVLLV
ncbi:MAG: hypothetical protein CUN56_04540 [Phototrophicales bacterium]|nr:MAG: hypothetical protein CUN56_04540 [Phototrophicales bacterium]RMG77350.1 MAG: phosphatidate cytidylyltransferase [Chloroflexota bacterium]